MALSFLKFYTYIIFLFILILSQDVIAQYGGSMGEGV
jgi:hypothetical protein